MEGTYISQKKNLPKECMHQRLSIPPGDGGLVVVGCVSVVVMCCAVE